MLDSIPEIEDIPCLDEDDSSSDSTGTMVDSDISGDEGTFVLPTGKLGIPVVVVANVSKVDIDGSIKCVEDSIRIEEVAISGL